MQETYLNTVDFSMRGFSCYNNICHDVSGRACGGVSVFVRDGIIHSRVPLNTVLQAEAVTITNGKVFTVCSLYLPPRDAIDIHELELLISQLPAPYILLGDFNAHNIVWGCDTNNNRGNSIYNFILDNNLCLLNDESYTYLHPGSGTFTAIDLSLASPGIYMDLTFDVETDTFGSDHFPIVLQCSAPVPDKLPRWNLNRGDWKKFQELCLQQIVLDIFDMNNEPISLFTRILFNIAKATIPRSTAVLRRLCKAWFNRACKEAIRLRKKAYKTYK